MKGRDMGSYRVYKANRNGNGTASEWQLSHKSQDQYSPWKCFLSLAPQCADADVNGNARFDWDNSIRLKMDITDLSEFLAVLEWKKAQAGFDGKIFHKKGDENKIINFSYNQKNNQYYLRVSHQTSNGVNTLQQGISLAEGCALQTLIQNAIVKMTGWGSTGKRRNPISEAPAKND